MTTINTDVPIPAGSSADGWAVDNEPRPFRLIWGPHHAIDGDAVMVRASATQYSDGAIDETAADGPAIHVDVCRDWGISTKHAREVAAAILEAADEADRLTQSPGTDQR